MLAGPAAWQDRPGPAGRGDRPSAGVDVDGHGDAVRDDVEHGGPLAGLLHDRAQLLRVVAAARGITLTEVSSTVEGDIDLLGILGLSDQVRNGYQQIRVGFTLRGDDPDKLRSVVEQSRQRSAVFDVVTNGVPVSIDVDAG